MKKIFKCLLPIVIISMFLVGCSQALGNDDISLARDIIEEAQERSYWAQESTAANNMDKQDNFPEMANKEPVTSYSESTAATELEIHFLDVGQGDCTLVKSGDETMLIDTGENDKGTYIQNYLNKQGVKELSYLILTHPHSDHIGSADVIISKYEIGTLIMPMCKADTVTYRDVIEAMSYKGLRQTLPVIGDTYSIGDATFTIVAPVKSDYGDEKNNYSVGILLRCGSRTFLFTGDAEAEAEADILNTNDINADVLKAGHHGSRSSSSKAFMEAVSPKYAVISCGEDNSYGHPHAQTLNTYRSMGIEVYRTDEQGTIIASCDGETITWNTSPSETWKAGEPREKINDNKDDTPAAIRKGIRGLILY